MDTRDTILVTGATGQQGGAVAKNLISKGQKVRALTRSLAKGEALEKIGAEVVAGNLTDQASLDSALQGIKQVFLVTTPFEAGMDTEVQQGITMVDAAKAAGVEHLVFNSVASADKKTGIPHFETKWEVEQHLRKSGVPATIIRPVFFIENFYSPWFLPSIQQGELMLPMAKDRPLQMISINDIGEFGASAFIRKEEFLNQEIDIAGDELDLNEAMRLLSNSLGRTVVFEQLPDDQAEETFGHDFAVMFHWFDKTGFSIDIPSLEQKWNISLTKYRDIIFNEDVIKRFD